MLAQVYLDDNPLVRIFQDNQHVADLPIPNGRMFVDADIALRLVGFQRCRRWKRTEWGGETIVRRRKWTAN